MDQNQGKIHEIQDSLRTLNLEAEEELNLRSHEVLLGRVLSTRNFRRYTISEIIAKTRKLKRKVGIEKIEENVFKFSFGDKEEKEKIFSHRPWSLNGAHLILKEWPVE